MDPSILIRKPDQMLINEKKGTCHLDIFAVSVNQRLKIKENEIIDQYPGSLILHVVVVLGMGKQISDFTFTWQYNKFGTSFIKCFNQNHFLKIIFFLVGPRTF